VLLKRVALGYSGRMLLGCSGGREGGKGLNRAAEEDSRRIEIKMAHNGGFGLQEGKRGKKRLEEVLGMDYEQEESVGIDLRHLGGGSYLGESEGLKKKKKEVV